jgi:hypothetical protein
MTTITLTDTTIDDMDADNIRVLFTFLTSAGDVVVDGYRIFPVNTNLAATSSAVGALLLNKIKLDELQGCVFVFAWDYVLKYNTLADLAAFVRQIYLNGSKAQLALTAKRILEWIANGRFTDTQVQNAFGLTSTQWTNLKAKMQNLVNSYTTVDTAVGE